MDYFPWSWAVVQLVDRPIVRLVELSFSRSVSRSVVLSVGWLAGRI
jgi:hypothetical protein